MRHVLADLHVAGGGDRLELAAGRRAGLHVPDIDRAGSATHVQQDRRLVTPLQVLGVGGQGVGEVHRRQGQRRGSGQMLEKMTASHAAGVLNNRLMAISLLDLLVNCCLSFYAVNSRQTMHPQIDAEFADEIGSSFRLPGKQEVDSALCL